MWDWLKAICWATLHLHLSLICIISWMGQGYAGATWYAWHRPLPHWEAQWWQHKGREREGGGCPEDWVGWVQKLFGVIHHLISGIADCSSAPSVLAWEGKGSYIPDIRLTVCIFFISFIVARNFQGRLGALPDARTRWAWRRECGICGIALGWSGWYVD